MATGLEVAEVFRRHGETYRQVHAEHLGRTEHRVMGAIAACRTAALGGHAEFCQDCGLVRCADNSCRNRHCPKCQGLARAEWLADRQAELLPVPYFHVVFTVPAQIAAIAFQNGLRDRGFESCSLQRGVSCEPDFLEQRAWRAEFVMPTVRHRSSRDVQARGEVCRLRRVSI